jgi:hypothetical protein
VGAGYAQHAQGLNCAVLGFRDAGAPAVQGVDRVEVVVLAFAAALGPVRPVDLQDRDAGFGEVTVRPAPQDPVPSTPIRARSPNPPIQASIAR